MMIVVECPCGSRFKADDRWAGRRAQCKHCGRELVIAEAATGLDEESSDAISLIDDALGQPGAKTTAPPHRGTRPFSIPTPIIETAESSISLATSTFGRYLKQCLYSLVLFCDPGSMATFFVLAILVTLSVLALAFLGCFGLLLVALVWAMVCAMLFATVEEAAAGKESLPNLEMPDDGFSGLLAAVFKFLGTIALVLIPAVLFGISAWYFDLLPPEQARTMTNVLAWIGVMLWPMVVLIVSMGDFGSLWRIDLILVTIARTFAAYVLLCILVGGTFAATRYAESVAASAVGGGGMLVAAIGGQVLSIYGMMVSMCFIGFYYHHFKHRFAWSWG